MSITIDHIKQKQQGKNEYPSIMHKYVYRHVYGPDTTWREYEDTIKLSVIWTQWYNIDVFMRVIYITLIKFIIVKTFSNGKNKKHLNNLNINSNHATIFKKPEFDWMNNSFNKIFEVFIFAWHLNLLRISFMSKEFLYIYFLDKYCFIILNT